MINKEEKMLDCPKCKKTYATSYSALSSVVNQTEICCICKETELITKRILGDEIEINAKKLSIIERRIRNIVVKIRNVIKPYAEELIMLREMEFEIQKQELRKIK